MHTSDAHVQWMHGGTRAGACVHLLTGFHRPGCYRSSMHRQCAVALLLVLTSAWAAAFAHGPDQAPDLASAWSLSPWFLGPAGMLLALYVAGLVRLWRRAGIGHGLSRSEASAFGAGTLALFFATVWPLDALGEWSLAAHMAQHMLLLGFVPPLLLAGRPLAVIAQGLPRRWSRRLHRLTARLHGHLAAALVPAAAAHMAVMGLWHLPIATGAALANEAVHWAMHGSFLLAGLWFWSTLLHRLRDAQAGAGAGLVAIVAVMMQMGFVGALLTFSPRALYPVYVERAGALGLTPLVDQQLAGMIMWVPACLPYLLGGLWLMQRGLHRAEQRQRLADQVQPGSRASPRP